MLRMQAVDVDTVDSSAAIIMKNLPLTGRRESNALINKKKTVLRMSKMQDGDAIRRKTSW
jgi:hypothetical protein